MNGLHRGWWRVLVGLRPVGRFIAGRFGVGAIGIRIRSLLHLAVGNPVTVALVLVVLSVPVSLLVRLVAVAVVVAGVEVAGWVVFERGSRFGVVSWLLGWRLGWRFRRLLPRFWADAAAKTARVQAEVGTASEPVAPQVLRPVLDHPPISWLPGVRWPVVEWWVGPPPGRTMDAWDELCLVLTAQLPHVSSMSVSCDSPGASWGRLVVVFSDSLTPVDYDLGTADEPVAAEVLELSEPDDLGVAS